MLSNGLAYGPFRDAQGANSRIYPTEEQIDEDLAFLSRMTKRIRNYGTASTLAQVPRIAKAHGIRVLGIYLGADRDENDVQIKDAMALARAGLIESLVVGNETLTARTLSKADPIAYIRKVKRDALAGARCSSSRFSWPAGWRLCSDTGWRERRLMKKRTRSGPRRLS